VTFNEAIAGALNWLASALGTVVAWGVRVVDAFVHVGRALIDGNWGEIVLMDAVIVVAATLFLMGALVSAIAEAKKQK